MSFTEVTKTELNVSLKIRPLIAESTTVKRELVGFDNRKTENEVDQDWDQKSIREMYSHVKSEEKGLKPYNEANFSLKTAESVTVKRELDDFEYRKTANDFDQDLDQKSTIEILGHIKSEEENFINSEYLISHEEINIKSDDDEEQSDNGFKTHKVKRKRKDQIKIYKCPDCPYQSNRKGNFKQHSFRHRKLDQKETQQFQMFKCAHCIYETPWKQNLKHHLMGHHGKHIIQIHCPEPGCLYKTHNRTQLKRHSSVHSSDQFFKCTQCPYQAKRHEYLKSHQLKHQSIDKWHLCPQCPYKTIRKTTLKQHVWTHANADELKWYMCEQCPYKTNRKSCLNRHVFTHNLDNVKLLQCTSCSFKTRGKYYFRQHQMKHQDYDEPGWHKCAECPYKTIHKSHLLTHSKNHKATDQIDWLQCSECSYRTPRSQHLKAHQTLHTGVVEWFRCSDCPYKTNWKPSLVFHVKTHLQIGQDKLS